MKCTSCSAEVPASAKFCPECGAKIVRKSFCPECGAEAAPGAKFCAECGTKLAASFDRLDENSAEVKAWHKHKDKLKDYLIPGVQDADISDEEIKQLLSLMRKRIKWAENHPGESDPYEALGSVYQDHYATLQQLADMRGIVVDDLPEK